MAAKKSVRLLILMCRVMLLSKALRYGLTLLRLGVGNALTLRTYKQSAGVLWRRPLLLEVWAASSRYARLFRMIPYFGLSPETDEQHRLMNIYRQTRQLCRQRKLKHNPLTSPSAIKLQRAIVRSTFQRLFSLELTEAETAVMGRYGSVVLAAKEFLEYCGYQDRAVAGLSLSLQLPLFVVQAKERHCRSSTQQSLLLTLNQKAALAGHWPLIGGMAALFFKWQQIVYRAYWQHSDMRSRVHRRACRSRIHEEAYRDVTKPTIGLAAASQRGILCVLAYEMFFQSLDVLADMHIETRTKAADLTAVTGAPPEQLFHETIGRLENNLRQVLPDCF